VLLLRFPHLDALSATLRERRDAAYARIAVDLNDARYLPLLADVRVAAERPAFTSRARTPADAFVPELLATCWDPLRRAVRRRSRAPTNGELHRIRIRAKHVRYAAEAVIPIAGGEAEDFARRVETLQTVLGEQHDAVEAYRVLRTLDARDGLTQAAMTLARAAADEGRRTWRAAWRDAQRSCFW
jgi:CHAD domain-containing protein